MLERIRRCQKCGVALDRRALEYMENPYCTNCLSEAVRVAGSPKVRWWRRDIISLKLPEYIVEMSDRAVDTQSGAAQRARAIARSLHPTNANAPSSPGVL